jgi:tetratricopeptide (TPR) repeat protein
LGDPGDLEAAIAFEQDAVDLTPERHPDRAGRLQSLGSSLTLRYRLVGDLKDLEAAMQNLEGAIELTPGGHPSMEQRLRDLGVSFTDRYRRVVDIQDLDSAFQKLQKALGTTPEGHPDRAGCLHSLGICYADRFQRLGHLKDLETVLKIKQELVDPTPQGHSDRAARLQSLAVSFKHLYRRLGDIKQLEFALMNFRETVNLTPSGHPGGPAHLQNLGVSLTDRFQRLGELKDLDDAMQHLQEAADLIPAKHPNRAICLQHLGTAFAERYSRLKDSKDLEATFQIFQEAVDSTPNDHPDRPGHLQNLAASFRDRYLKLENLDDLQSALKLEQEVVNITPDGHPDRPERLQNLAISFGDVYQTLGDPTDLEAVHNNFSNSFGGSNTSSPEVSWENALRWASFAERFQPSDCSIAYEAAFNLLPELLWIGNSIPVRQDAICRLDIGQATSAAAKAFIFLRNFTSAVEIIEQGLATTFQQMLQLKTDVDKLPIDLAENFRRLSFELYGGTSDDPLKFANERNELIKDIRKKRKLKYFLLPKPYEALSYAAQGGSVVILNSHKRQCDGIIILCPTAEPVHVSLPNVTLDQLQSQKMLLSDLLRHGHFRMRGESESTRIFAGKEQFKIRSSEEGFADLLAWLWTNIVSPVYDVLKSVGGYCIRPQSDLTLSFSVVFTTGGFGGCLQEHSRDCLCTQVLRQMNSPIHTHQH